MSGKNEIARNLLAQEPGRDKRHAIAAHILIIADNYNLRQALLLRMAHGLTEAHTLAFAQLIWGASI
jgi:hypothetical protein